MSVNRLCFIPGDGSLQIDGVTFFDVHLDWVPSNIRVVNWYGDEWGGEIEFNHEGGNPLGHKPHNEKITELGEWEKLIDEFYNEKKRREDAEIARAEAAEASRNFLEELRGIRTQFLMFSDWTQLPDVSLTEEQKIAWSEYREQLRNLPETVSDPKAMVIAYYNNEIHPDWPISPQ